MKNIQYVVLLLVVILSSVTQAKLQDSSLVTAYECTQISVDTVDNDALTKAERLALMDRHLQTSIDEYEQCTAQQIAKSGQAQGNGGGQGQGAAIDADNSAANASNDNSHNQQITQTDNTTSQTSAQQQTPVNRELVAPKDNDSIICRLLWEEIQTAPADKLAGFEKQYKDYKCG